MQSFLRFNDPLQFSLCYFIPRYTYGFSGGGTKLFFPGRGALPGFLKYGAWEVIIASKRGAGGSCEIKISRYGGLRAKIWAIIAVVEAKISLFSQKGGGWAGELA